MELLECDGGWLNPIEGSLRVAELRELRLLCIPRLVSMLMQICKESDQQQLWSVDLADGASECARSVHRVVVVRRLICPVLVCRSRVSLPLADVLASPSHHLHTCFTPDQLRALLKQFRAAYIDVHMQQHNNDAGDIAVE
jgi:hypothetical protein